MGGHPKHSQLLRVLHRRPATPDAEPENLDRGSDGRNTVHLLTLDLDVAGENVAVWLREVKKLDGVTQAGSTKASVSSG